MSRRPNMGNMSPGNIVHYDHILLRPSYCIREKLNNPVWFDFETFTVGFVAKIKHWVRVLYSTIQFSLADNNYRDHSTYKYCAIHDWRISFTQRFS